MGLPAMPWRELIGSLALQTMSRGKVSARRRQSEAAIRWPTSSITERVARKAL
jgi:hypothetical protein